MQSSTGKTFGRKTYEMPLNLGLKTKENYESWENLFRKTMAKDPLFSFTRTTENPIHWIHLLDPFDQHDVSKGSRVDSGQKTTSSPEKASSSGISSESTKVNGKGGKGCTKGSQAFGGEKIPSLKLPEAVVALAQVAAKATGGSLFGGSTDLSGWPLIPPAKVQMMKCEKCPMEFCSPLNYKRHVRMIHRRPSNAEKDDFSAQRQQLAVFWDNLAPEAARDIVRRNNLVLEDLSGESLVKALTGLLQQPSLFSLPLPYAKAGASLLELVQNKSTRSLLASSDLLNVLDDSSEKTFPSFACGSMHRYVFDNEARKVGLEIKNLVAALGFLVERNLVKAWIYNKDVEALRCQIALVEEEEASQRKRAEIQEKKRLKKARQKESRDKERKPVMSLQQAVDTMDDGSPLGSEDGDEYLVEKQSGHPATLTTQTDTKLDASYLEIHSRPSSSTSENMFLKLAEDASDTDDRLAVSDNVANSEANDLQNPQGNESQHEDCPISADETFLPLNPGSAEGSQLESDQKAISSGSSKVCFREGHAPDRKFRHTWRERKWSGTNGFRSFQKQAEWGSYSLTSEGTGNPSARYGKSFQEIPVSLASRSEHSADRSYASKRQFYNNAGSGHAVWARKVQSGTTANSDVVDLQTSLDSVSSADYTNYTTSSKISKVVGDSMPVPTVGTNSAVSQSCSSLISLESSSTPDGSDLDSMIVSSDVAQNHGPAESGEVDYEIKGGIVRIEPESDAACDTLVIGSLSVPLGVSFVDPPASLPEITVATCDKRRRTDMEETQKSGVEALGALHENSVSQSGSCKDVTKDKSLKSWLYVDPECKENLGNSAIVQERPSKMARPSGYEKYGRLKVWRPIRASSLEASTREPLTAETPGSNDYAKAGKSSDSGDAHSKTSDNDGGLLSGKLDSCDIEVSQDVEACDEMLVVSGAEQDNKLTQKDAVENTLVDECDHQSRLWSTDFIAHFLSERWTDAVNSTDSDIHQEEEEHLNESVEDMGNIAVESRIIHKHWHSGTGIRAAYGKNGKAELNGSRYNFSRPGLGEPVRFKPRESLHWTSKAGNGGYKYVPK